MMRSYLTSDHKWRHAVGGAKRGPAAGLSALPNFFTKGLLCLEDSRFFYHPGFDPLAIGRAVVQNFRSGTVVSGASTITMQLVRLLEPRPRTIGSKAIELLRAIQLELRLSKEEILDLYLTYTPYGGNIEGIEAAAQRYFGHGASELTPGQAAFLYLLPQSPSRFANLDRQHLRDLRTALLGRLRECEVLSPEQIAQAEREPIPTRIQVPPVLAPHYSDFLVQRHPDRHQLVSHIDIDLQRQLEEFVGKRREYYRARGVNNITLLVVDNETGAVTSAIGNFAYFEQHHSQNYGSFTVLRSPGSTLKPFLYAYLIGRGDLLPDSLLLDIPSKYENYQPQNFTGLYSGLVTAEHALSQSLNVPFVRELQKLGLDEFLALLDAGGVKQMTPIEELGLSSIIGAIEVNAFALTQLYTALATGGKIRPLQHLRMDRTESYGWLHPAAVYLTNQALAKRDRPDFPGGGAAFRDLSRVKWKTGTSQGRRDAWSIGFRDRYTVAVWLGNLDMEPSPLLTGSDAAAPLMFRVLSMLQDHQATPAPVPYEQLAEVRVCSFSGWKATEHCPHTKRALAIHDHPLGKPCPYHDRVLVDLASGLRVTRQCDEGLKTGYKNVMTIPQDILFWMRHSLRGLTPKPRFHPQCKTVPTESGNMVIKQPAAGATYYLTQGRDDIAVPLAWESTSALADTACYLDGRRLALADMEFRRYVRVGPGQHYLFCADLFGKSDQVAFRVLTTRRHF